jgi:biopolymer transport protein TolR
MGMQVGTGAKKGVQPAVNMTPLIDVVLVLLIIFMVLTPQMLKQLAVNVPKKAEQDQPVDLASDQLIVSLGPDHKILVNNEPFGKVKAVAGARYDTGDFGGKLKQLLSKRRSKVVFFNIDDDANYGEAVRVMDVSRGAGAKTLGIMTKE